MRLINVIERPSALLPAVVCVSSAAGTVRSTVQWAPIAGAHQVSSAYQAPVQAELAHVLAGVGGGSLGSGSTGINGSTSTNGTTGFKGSNGFDLAMKRRTEDASGVPPRGRPV